MNRPRICSKTVLDTTIPGITFDENGVCHYVKIYEWLDRQYPIINGYSPLLENLIKEIKSSGEKKEFDCVVGVSGGTDSTYTLLKAVECGLKPLAVHCDTGWNSVEAVKNIKNACNKLNVPLVTYVLDWEEFKALQVAFLKASVPDVDIPADVAIHSVLIKTAAKEGIKYVLNGHSFRNEFLMPIGWTYMDGRYISSVYKIFNQKKLKKYPNFTLFDLFYFNILRGIKVVPFLNYFDYKKPHAKQELREKLHWHDYGGHHHESIFTHFVQSYYLPKKFNIDKRKTELSAMILNGVISREEALEILKTPYPFRTEIVEYVCQKLDISPVDFEKIMGAPNKTFLDYPTYYPLIKKIRPIVKLATRWEFLPELIYRKYYF